jgi:hypothetical protein
MAGDGLFSLHLGMTVSFRQLFFCPHALDYTQDQPTWGNSRSNAHGHAKEVGVGRGADNHRSRRNGRAPRTP